MFKKDHIFTFIYSANHITLIVGEINMATYKQIQEFLKNEHGRTFKSCWIAHVKSDHGLTKRQAPNRYEPDKRVHPCPHEYRQHVENALKHFKMIP